MCKRKSFKACNWKNRHTNHKFMPYGHVNLYYQVIPQEVVEAHFSACRSSDFDVANKEVNNIIAEGYPVSLFLSQVPT